MSAEEPDSLPLADLLVRAYPPPDPRTGEMKYETIRLKVITKLLFLAAAVVAPVLYKLLKWVAR